MHRFFFGGGVCHEIKTASLEGKVVLITGATNGSLGGATAKIFQELKATIVVTATAEERAVASANEVGGEGHALNLMDDESIHEFVDWFSERYERLDILVNNAGIHLDLLSQWKKPHLSDKGIELMWHTNYLGTFLLTQLLLPKLEAAGDIAGEARVVNVVSELHRWGDKSKLLNILKTGGSYEDGYNSWKAYAQSKLAVVMFTNELNRLEAAKGKKVIANSLHPGPVKTNVAGKGLKGNKMILMIRDAMSCIETFFLKTPEEGAQTSVYCSISKDLDGVGGKYFKDCKALKASKHAYDLDVAKSMYEETLKLVLK
mmetsp:Transcript_17965/g.22930  ORF Transcript_17965/g.22930 Transcript_17965/m.22930 type:complete len:316 (-) Transcript_17965:380-1327(-)